MIETPLLVFLNTHGVVVLVIFIFLYEVLIVKNTEVALHILLSTISVIVFSLVLKELFLVPRPFLADGTDALAGLSYYSSLPSIHAGIAFALATTTTLHQKKLGVLLFTIAALISVGRVMAYVHYPIDIILGMLIGVLTGVIFNQIHIKFRKSKRVNPV